MLEFAVAVFGEIADFLIDLWVNKITARFRSREDKAKRLRKAAGLKRQNKTKADENETESVGKRK